jgi:hypothetical protein
MLLLAWGLLYFVKVVLNSRQLLHALSNLEQVPIEVTYRRNILVEGGGPVDLRGAASTLQDGISINGNLPSVHSLCDATRDVTRGGLLTTTLL